MVYILLHVLLKPAPRPPQNNIHLLPRGAMSLIPFLITASVQSAASRDPNQKVHFGQNSSDGFLKLERQLIHLLSLQPTTVEYRQRMKAIDSSVQKGGNGRYKGVLGIILIGPVLWVLDLIPWMILFFFLSERQYSL